MATGSIWANLIKSIAAVSIGFVVVNAAEVDYANKDEDYEELFEQLEPGTMVVLDELCSGTNPSEGIAIFNMVVGLLPRLSPQVFVTTHFLDAARRLEEDGDVPRLEFLQSSEQPRHAVAAIPTAVDFPVRAAFGRILLAASPALYHAP